MSLDSSLSVLLVFTASVLAGKALRVRVPGLVFDSFVLLVVLSVSAWAAASGASAAAWSIEVAAGLLVLLVVLTLAAAAIAPDRAARGVRLSPRVDRRIVAAIAAGWLCGLLAPQLSAQVARVLSWEVLALIAVTGLYVSSSVSLRSVSSGARSALAACAVGVLIAVAAGAAGSVLLGVPLGLSVAATLGMGWYSFTGPYIASFYGPAEGFAAFLLNVLREQVTFLLVPLVRGSRVVMLSLGGATTMDNTLPVYVYTYGEDFASASILHGFILTVAAPFLVSAALSI